MTRTAQAPGPAASPASLSRRTQIAIAALAVGGFGIGATEFTIMGLLDPMVRDLGITIPEGGHVISAYALGVVIGAPTLAALGSRLPRKTLALGLLTWFTLANASSFWAADYSWLLVTRFLSGLPHGAYFGVAAVIAGSLVPVTRRGWAMSMVLMGLSVANVIGVPLITWLGQTAGWRTMFLAVAVIGMAALLAVTLTVPHEPAPEGASMRGELRGLKHPQLWLALGIGTVGFGGFFAVYSYISPTLLTVTGIPEATLPFAVGVYGVGMVVGNWFAGILADKSVMGTIFGACIGIMALEAGFALLSPWAVPAFILIFLIGASGSFLVAPLQKRLVDVAPDAPSLAASLNHSALNMANSLGAFLGGAVIAAGFGLQAPAWVGVGLAFLGLLLALVSHALDRRSIARSH
ncbi:MFS transporter [Falsarthrobacter nasiphocae]|uniref:DHA1 family inner membrane transport protein n=1 Tax=Falsarthrobacter nasiphocae TaxID=189863 RepID=A0AAE3YJ67_9MICC|nr:MFS transporter [Falsarthrobacter nasiphocae]MDR6892696.1 DHA1 family inner membrane transport protein [Falsarthrobacter nasiphocae]